jgi:hypothetical protein
MLAAQRLQRIDARLNRLREPIRQVRLRLRMQVRADECALHGSNYSRLGSAATVATLQIS